MISEKGFLMPGKGDNPRRMTAEQQAAVLEALGAVFDHERRSHSLKSAERIGLTYAECLISTALGRYPNDRSCYTCGLFIGATCQHFNSMPPEEFRETGCEHHQADGIPF